MTSKDIARICGVSRGTVDRALNGRGGISPETRRKILDVIQQHGYRPDLMARSLSTGRTKLVGVVVFNLRNQFFSQLITSIDVTLREHGYVVHPTFTEHVVEEESERLSRLCGLNVEGIILFPANVGRAYEQFLRSLGKPIVMVGNRVSAHWPFVGIDDANAMRDAVHFIAGRGYGDILYVSPPLANPDGQNIYEVEQRYRGFRRGMQEVFGAAHPTVIEGPDYLERVLALVSQGGEPRRAVLCSSDIYALRLLRHLRAHGLQVPRDIGLMGFDNLDVLEYVQPRLATVDYHIADIGARAARLLLRLIEDPTQEEAQPTVVTHTVVAGESL